MRTIALLPIGFGAFLLVCMAFFRLAVEPEGGDQAVLFEEVADRRSITFIMGEDKEEHAFYGHATAHFALDPDERTDYVVRTCRTVADIIAYLNASEGRGEQPWSVIHIVAHGNPQTGLNLYITEDGHKATPKRLVQAVLLASTPQLREGVIDSTTRINFWSCGIGKSPLLRFALSRIFRPDGGDSAHVYCSPHFVIFHPSETGHAPYRLKASYWPYYYRRGYRPGDLEIVQALRSQYPDAHIDWLRALENVEGRDTSEVRHGEYHIPVSYTRIYPSKAARPDFQSEEDKIAWALSQPAIREQIEETGIPADRFHWTVNKIIHTTEDGERVPAVKAIGMATVLYVLRSEE